MVKLALDLILFSFGSNPISWSYKKQKGVTTETALAALIALCFSPYCLPCTGHFASITTIENICRSGQICIFSCGRETRS
jgi:hypothetical protein